MKILLISDVHGDYNALKDVYNQNLNCDYYFLLGDSMLPKYLTSDFLTVKGNCDFEDYKESYDLVIENFKIHIQHGHKIYPSLENYVKNIDCDIFIFGHLHKKIYKKLDKKIIINPGSLTKPRDSNVGSYALLIIEKNNIKVEFKNYSFY